MIARIHIKDFQKWPELRIKLESITSFVGPSDSGKSSCVRALRWLFLNRPQGSRFIRKGESSCSVKALIDGETLERVKTKRENYYRIASKGEPFKAIRSDVPQAVQELVNVDERNFQRQHDPVFWFTLSPPEVARQLNAIVDLDIVDEIQGHMSAEVRDNRKALQVAQEISNRASEELKTFEGLEALDANLRDLEEDYLEADVLKKRLLLQIAAVQSLREAEEAIVELPDNSQVEKLLEEVDLLRKQNYQLEKAVFGLTAHNNEIRERGLEIQKLEKEIQEKTGGVCPLCGQQGGDL